MGIFKKKKIGKTTGRMGRYRPNLEMPASRRRRIKKVRTTEKKILKTKAERRKIKKIIRPLALIAGGIVLYLIGHLLFLSGIFTIKNVDFNHNQIEVEDENPVLAYLNNFEGSNILLINETEEETYLKETYPQYKTINIKKSLPSTIVLDIETYEKVANIISVKDGFSKKFIVNEQGMAVETNSEDPSLPYIYIETVETLTERKTIIEPEKLEFIIEATTDFENKFGLQIIDATYYKTAREVHLRTEMYFDVWMDTQIEVDEQLMKLKQALPQLNIYEDPIRYIDLRISGQSGDKVIYMPN